MSPNGTGQCLIKIDNIGEIGLMVDYLDRVGAVEVSWCSEPAKDFQLNVAIVRDDAGQLVFWEESKNTYAAVFSALVNNLLISCFNGAGI